MTSKTHSSRALASPVSQDAPAVHAPGGRRPDVLEIGLAGRRRVRVEAYWDGCLIAM